MSKSNNHTKHMHFKAAQISAAELSPNEMAMINSYALSPLEPEEVFAFKVSMAGNDIDRDFEVFPYATLQKFANLFVGKTVIKDHQHVSDNQIARIYSTNLVEGEPMRMTKGGEIYTELIAKCYMVKTASNADLIAEIQAGIRKEVSLGCRIGKAICSICSKDNVKSYCNHFPGKEYKGETCYFSLEDPTDAYELSFVAIPAQQHAGTVKSYGDKPCSAEDLEAAATEQEPSQNAADADRPADTSMEGASMETDSIPPAAAEGSEEGDDTDESAGDGDDLSVGTGPETTSTEDTEDEGPIDCMVKADETQLPKGNREAGEEAGNAEAVSKALDDFTEKLQSMWERIEACNKALDKIAEMLESKDDASALGESQNLPAPEQAQPEAPEASEEQASEQENRLTVNQAQDEEQISSEPHATESNPEKDSAGYEPAITFADAQDAQEELKAKQAQARLRALDMALSIRTRA